MNLEQVPPKRDNYVGSCKRCERLELMPVLKRNDGICARCVMRNDVVSAMNDPAEWGAYLEARGNAEAITEYLSSTCDPSIAIKPRRPTPDHDPVHRPAHYRREGYELIEVMRAFGLLNSGCRMQAVQYLFRCGAKGATDSELHNLKLCLEDLQKAAFYVNYEIGLVERRIAEISDDTERSPGKARPD